MFINFWYPVVLSAELGPEPRKVRMLGTDFAVFRDTGGAPRVIANVCPHRGGSLADGRLKGDSLQCPYHGWQFDGLGVCRRIPSLGSGARIPGRARVDAYPVVEKYGIVFAFLGDLPEDERPPLLEIPEYGREGWRATLLRFEVPFNYQRSVENGIDPAHNEFVHPTHGFSGEREDYRLPPLRYVADTEWGGGFLLENRSPASGDPEFAKVKQATEARQAGTGTIGPNQVWTYIRFAPGKRLHQYLWETPVDERRTTIFFVNMRNTFLEEAMDGKISQLNWMIAEQDIRVLKDVMPPVTPRTNVREFMVPADEPILKYRRRLRAWERRGWRIDAEAMARAAGSTAWAIPSPERRREKGWVLDTVPLLAPDTSGDEQLPLSESA